MPPSSRITIRLTPALEALVSDGVRQGTSVSDLVREALEAYLGGRPTPRPTPTMPASDSVQPVSATVSDLSDIRERLGRLEQRVEALSATIRHNAMLSDTQDILDIPATQGVDAASDIVSDTRPTQRENVAPHEPAPLSDTEASSCPALSDTEIPPFDTSKFVLGKLCPRNHEYYGTGMTLRRVFRHVCPACDVERTRAARKTKRGSTW